MLSGDNGRSAAPRQGYENNDWLGEGTFFELSYDRGLRDLRCDREYDVEQNIQRTGLAVFSVVEENRLILLCGSEECVGVVAIVKKVEANLVEEQGCAQDCPHKNL